MAENLYYAFLIIYVPFIILCLIMGLVDLIDDWDHTKIEYSNTLAWVIVAFIPLYNISVSIQMLPDIGTQIMRIIKR